MNARETALRALQETEGDNRKSEEVLNRLLQRTTSGKADRALARELVSGTLKYRRQCDFIIGRFYRHDYAKAAPVLKNILRLGVYQLLHLDRIPRPAAVDECVKLARKYKGDHLSRLVNGVLRKISPKSVDLEAWTAGMDESERLAVTFSFPVPLVGRWLERYGTERTERLLAHANRPPATAYRVNQLKGAFEQLSVQPGFPDVRHLGDGLDRFFFTQDFGAMEPMLAAGLVSVQNPTQALACLLAAPEPGTIIYDMCAAPGGKATFMAELMQNRGRIIALDRSAKKLQRLAANRFALGITIIEPEEGDAATFTPGCTPGTILLDAPCTGTGVLGRRPELRWRIGMEKLNELTSLQATLLDKAAELLPPGGILLYSTCSIEPEENEHQINAFLGRHPEFVQEPLPESFPEDWLPELAGPGWMLTLPGEREGFDGGFAARLRKQREP